MSHSDTVPKRVKLLKNVILDTGVAVSHGQLLGDARDGLDFIFLADYRTPSVPIIAMTLPVAGYALFAMALEISEMMALLSSQDEELVEKLLQLREASKEVAEALIKSDR